MPEPVQPKPKRLPLLPFETPGTDHDGLYKWLRQLPTHLDNGYFEGIPEQTFSVLANADSVEMQLKHYLIGHHKTLHDLFFAIRRFLKTDEVKARQLIAGILQRTHDVIVQRELYELLPRFDVSRRRIRKAFGI